jgi:hypothetical protein
MTMTKNKMQNMSFSFCGDRLDLRGLKGFISESLGLRPIYNQFGIIYNLQRFHIPQTNTYMGKKYCIFERL